MTIDYEVKKLLYGCAAMSGVRLITGSFHAFFFLSMGVSITQLALLQIVFSVAICIFEVPCGILGDKIGVKQNVILSCFFFSLFFFLCIYAPNLSVLIPAEIIYALGFALCSGADSTWIKGLIDGSGYKGSLIYHQVNAYKRELTAFMNTVAGALGVLIVLCMDNYQSAYYFCSFGFLVLVFLFSRVTGIGIASVSDSQPIDSGSLLHATEAFAYLVTSKIGLYYILICGFIVAALQPIFHFWQPFILGQTGVLDNATGKTKILILGLCFVSYTLVKYLFNRFVIKYLMQKYAPMAITLYSLVLSAVVMLALLLVANSWAPIILFTVFHSFFSVPVTQFEAEFFKHIQQKNANTVLSIVSFLARIFGILALVLIGWLANNVCIEAAFCFTLLCICLIIPLNLAWLYTDKKLIKDEEV
ncbi:MFS transporter [Bartonella sp. TS25HLJMH]|uniref:MFS transporter n=1 Tax=Bartonella sp. TS25HLJMH TaxID=3243576 RepID=UPI0035D10906